MSGKEAIDSSQRVIAYMQLTYRFWHHKLCRIKSSMNNTKNLISNDEKKKIDKAIKKAEKELNHWFKY